MYSVIIAYRWLFFPPIAVANLKKMYSEFTS